MRKGRGWDGRNEKGLGCGSRVASDTRGGSLRSPHVLTPSHSVHLGCSQPSPHERDRSWRFQSSLVTGGNGVVNGESHGENEGNERPSVMSREWALSSLSPPFVILSGRSLSLTSPHSFPPEARGAVREAGRRREWGTWKEPRRISERRERPDDSRSFPRPHPSSPHFSSVSRLSLMLHSIRSTSRSETTKEVNEWRERERWY